MSAPEERERDSQRIAGSQESPVAAVEWGKGEGMQSPRGKGDGGIAEGEGGGQLFWREKIVMLQRELNVISLTRVSARRRLSAG